MKECSQASPPLVCNNEDRRHPVGGPGISSCCSNLPASTCDDRLPPGTTIQPQDTQPQRPNVASEDAVLLFHDVCGKLLANLNLTTYQRGVREFEQHDELDKELNSPLESDSNLWSSLPHPANSASIGGSYFVLQIVEQC